MPIYLFDNAFTRYSYVSVFGWMRFRLSGHQRICGRPQIHTDTLGVTAERGVPYELRLPYKTHVLYILMWTWHNRLIYNNIWYIVYKEKEEFMPYTLDWDVISGCKFWAKRKITLWFVEIEVTYTDIHTNIIYTANGNRFCCRSCFVYTMHHDNNIIISHEHSNMWYTSVVYIAISE